jgi:hypothetical protein
MEGKQDQWLQYKVSGKKDDQNSYIILLNKALELQHMLMQGMTLLDLLIME